ncbi:TAT leader-containing periplasmic protein [Paraferrimonas haliotis]|uniref:TAT leader-containing periplasmic protein n=1 Tax=Paraferrimonas haliotis TaxID=2013866 RepID=A0AA37TXU4_9GAMM|nr:TAT leader-containing periplasmic protein [Paraferrimonas haliotis]GLS83351.1 TAT leader-containing periplasmic protein [Paraferrimonas haliotis]
MRRRTFLTIGIASTAAMAFGVKLYSDKAFDDSNYDEHHRVLLAALVPVLLDGILPEVTQPRQRAINRCIDNCLTTISLLPEHQAEQMQELLQSLEAQFGNLLLVGSITPLALQSPAQIQQVLESWRNSFIEMLQQAYLGLRNLIIASYYSDPDVWPTLGYHKPNIPGAS